MVQVAFLRAEWLCICYHTMFTTYYRLLNFHEDLMSANSMIWHYAFANG